MKTIVLLTDQLHKIGGINSLIQLKANYWAENKGYQVHIITTEQGSNLPFYDFSPKVQRVDLRIDYDRNKSYFGKRNFLKVFTNLIRLRRQLKEINPNLLIIANHIPVTLFFPLLGTKAKILKEYHFTQYYKSKERPSLLRRFETHLESQLDFQVVLSEEEKSFYNTERAIHIPNPIPFTKTSTPSFGPRNKVALAAGRISAVKRFDVLLDIWAEFKKRDKEWNLEIYGEGMDHETENLREQIRALGISESVKILKPVNNLPEIMESKGMYLMTSAQECFPMVLLEAQVSGLPIISYDCPTGPRNIIQSGNNGILVEMDNKASFVEAMTVLSQDENYRVQLAQNGFDSVQNYKLDNIMEKWDNQIINRIQ